MLKTAVNKLNINRKNESLKEYNDENLKAKESYEDIKKYIDKNVFCEDFSLNKMASDIGYNNNYLSSLIKEIYGLSFQDLSNKLRMEKARILLLTSDMKNQEIADAVGICSGGCDKEVKRLHPGVSGALSHNIKELSVGLSM